MDIPISHSERIGAMSSDAIRTKFAFTDQNANPTMQQVEMMKAQMLREIACQLADVVEELRTLQRRAEKNRPFYRRFFALD